MSASPTPAIGCYRLVHGVRLLLQDEQMLVLSEYPLRAMRVNATAARVLALCQHEHTCEQLARKLAMPLKRVEALCDQLRWKDLLEAGPMTPPTVWPAVSIVIPSYNRARELERCLHSLFQLEYPASSLEILVVDDGSSDDTQVMLQRMKQKARTQNLSLRVIRHEQRQGVAISRNTGAEAAQHELIAYIDSDCVASASWLHDLVPAFHDTRVGAVGGKIRAYERKSMIGRYEDVRSSLFMGERAQQIRPEGPLTYVPTANLLIRKSLWQQLGGFAPLTQGEDVDFCRRLLLIAKKLYYIPYGTVYHDYRTTIKGFMHIRVAYASSEASLLKRHPTERRILLLPPEQAIFAGAIIGALWACVWGVWMMGRPLYRRSSRERDGRPQGSSLPNTMGTIRRMVFSVLGREDPCGLPCACGYPWWRDDRPFGILLMIVAFLITIAGTRSRVRKVREQHIPVTTPVVFKATLRGNLSYTYHLCRHLTRYYTLPLYMVGIFLPPLLVLLFILFGIVTIVDYVRLKPDMGLGEYAWCAFLDDCAYQVGLVQGCVQQRTWKPLVPVCKRSVER